MKIKITDFKGQNRYLSRTNLADNQFYLIKNFRIDKVAGKLTRRGGLDATYPEDPTTETISGAIQKIINYFHSDGTEHLKLIEDATTGWAFQVLEPTYATPLITDTGIERGTYHPVVIIHNDIVRVYLGDIGGTTFLLSNLWYGNIDKDFFDEEESYDDEYIASCHLLDHSYHDDAAVGDLPSDWYTTNYNMWAEGASLTTQIVNPCYRFTWTYDDYQESTFVRDISRDNYVETSRKWDAGGFTSLAIYLQIKQSYFTLANKSHTASDDFNKRITGINIYRTKDTSIETIAGWNGGQDRCKPDDDASWYKVESLDITEGDGTASREGESVYGFSFTDVITDTDLVGKQLYDTRMGHTSECNMLDIQYATFHKSRIFAVKTFKRTVIGTTGARYNERLYYSSEQVTSAGSNYALDSFADLDFISVGRDDGDIPTGIIEWEDRLIVFKKDRKYRVYIASPIGNSIVDEEITLGCYAPRTLIKTRYGIFYMSRGSVFLFNGMRDIDVGLALKPIWDSYSDENKQNAFAVYNNAEEQYMLFISDGTDIYCYVLSMKTGQPEWVEFLFDSGGASAYTISEAKYLDENDVYIGSTIGTTHYIEKYNEDADTDGDYDIIPDLRSKIFVSEQDKDLLFTEIGVRYIGRGFTVTFYKENDTSVGSISFANTTYERSVLKKLSMGIQGNAVWFKIVKLDDDTLSDLQIDDIEIDIGLVDRIIQ